MLARVKIEDSGSMAGKMARGKASKVLGSERMDRKGVTEEYERRDLQKL